MTEVNRALHALWSGLQLPVYRKGCVPVQQKPPYVIAEPAVAAPFEKTVLTVEGWFPAPGATEAAAAMLDQAATILPPGGLLLPVGTGLLALYRAPGAWQNYVQDKNDPMLAGDAAGMKFISTGRKERRKHADGIAA